jgi:four helix bundle protein
MSGFKDFKDLDVYKLSERLCDSVWDTVLTWSRLAQDTVGKQLVRAADSIGANIAEGHGSGSSLENRRFVRISKRSLNETRHWLRRAHSRRLLTPAQTTSLHDLLEALRPRLINYLASLNRRIPVTGSRQPLNASTPQHSA